MTQQCQPLRTAVQDALTHFGYQYEDMRGSIIFEVVTDGRATWRWRSQAIMYEPEQCVEINIFVTDDLFLETRRAWVAELSARFNDTVPAGTWVYRYDEQDVRFRVVRTFRQEAEITADAVAHLLETVAFPLKLWDKAFSYRYDDDLTPQDALELALVAEEAYDGDGLENVVKRAIMSVCEPTAASPKALEDQKSPAATPALTLLKCDPLAFHGFRR